MAKTQKPSEGITTGVTCRAKASRRRATASAALAIAAGSVVLAGCSSSSAAPSTTSTSSPSTTAAGPVIGADLHTLTVVGDALYVGGHDAAAVSRDGGKTWQQIPSLNGADAMGWASAPHALLVGGHPGLFRSTDGGATFTKVLGAAAPSDVHGLGGAGGDVYLASPTAGLLASTDGGDTWQVRDAAAGRTFMGTLLVDPKNPSRLIAPDMSAGLTASTDGGRTWTPLGGPMGAMAAAWSPTDTRRIVAVGMEGGALSSDDGAVWRPLALPRGTSAVTFDSSGDVMYAGVLDGTVAHIYRSGDGGATWTAA